MKPLAAWLGAALLILTFTGCDEDPSAASAANLPPPSADGRPAGFEDMMKGMDKNMKNATADAGKMSKAKAK